MERTIYLNNGIKSKLPNRRVLVGDTDHGICIHLSKYEKGLTETTGVYAELHKGCVQYSTLFVTYESAIQIYQNLEIVLKKAGKI